MYYYYKATPRPTNNTLISEVKLRTFKFGVVPPTEKSFDIRSIEITAKLSVIYADRREEQKIKYI